MMESSPPAKLSDLRRRTLVSGDHHKQFKVLSQEVSAALGAMAKSFELPQIPIIRMPPMPALDGLTRFARAFPKLPSIVNPELLGSTPLVYYPESHLTSDPHPQLGRPTNLFRRQGDYWTLSFGANQPIFIKDSVGLVYIHHLIQHPGHEFPVLMLVQQTTSLTVTMS